MCFNQHQSVGSSAPALLLHAIARPWPRMLVTLCAAALTLFIGTAPAAATADPTGAPAILVDGQRLPADVPAVVVGEHVLVPLRGVFERFGADVWFDAGSQLAVASLRGVTVKVALGSTDAWVNGEHRRLEIGAREIAGRTLVPLRFIAEALGVSVDYDAASNSVVIVSGFKAGNFAAASASDARGAGNFFITSAPKRAPAVQDESPHQGDLIGSQYPQIYARFNGGSSAVNPSSVRVSVDGEDVTGLSTVSSAYVSYTPQSSLQTGQHTVEVNGAADDGTPFSDSWTFRVDAGSSSLYMPSGFAGSGFSGGFTANGFGDGFNPFLFPRFGFFPPGFSVFTPGPLFLVSGGVIEVIFFSRFFPFVNPFFSINGIPGTFPLTPWAGNPGFFWGFTTVPFGAHSHRAIIAAHFALPNGRKMVVHSTAPLEIEGDRRELPASLHYAVLPTLVAHPTSPRHLAIFRRLEPAATALTPRAGTQLRVLRGDGQTITIRSALNPASSPRAGLKPAAPRAALKPAAPEARSAPDQTRPRARSIPSAGTWPTIRNAPSARNLPSMPRFPVGPFMHAPAPLHPGEFHSPWLLRGPTQTMMRSAIAPLPARPFTPAFMPFVNQPLRATLPAPPQGANPKPK